MAILDPRLIRIGVEVRGEIQTFSDLAMTVVGTKFANPNQGECLVTIANLSQSTVDFILTETSPFNRNFTPKRLIVEAGRRSTGYSLLYTGIIFRSSITQPPDAILSIRAITGQFQKGNIVARSGAETTRLSAIARNVAVDIEATLNFQATDTEVSNYSFTGAAVNQVEKLEEIADVDAYVDNDQLIVKNRGEPLANRVRRLDAETGMIGVPTFTEQGAKITFLFDNQTVLGGMLNVTSSRYPALTGLYSIYKLNYNLSNRDVPFYYTAECVRLRSG